MSNRPLMLAAALVLAAPTLFSPAQASESQDPNQGWSATGELGLALARGNARSENLNTKLNLKLEDAGWTHSMAFSALRAKGEVSGDFDGDGSNEERFELNANRYEFAASSAIEMNARAYWIGALRYEKDDFAPFDNQTTFSLGYGYKAIDSESTQLSAELGPGYRRAELNDGRSESETIVRGQLGYAQELTANSKLSNVLLVESGADNTFAQNELGLTVAMNQSLALKAGLQLRYNSEVEAVSKNTDSLTTVNLVYTFK